MSRRDSTSNDNFSTLEKSAIPAFGCDFPQPQRAAEAQAVSSTASATPRHGSACVREEAAGEMHDYPSDRAVV
jgi:hypothetical protein